jgi:hypothetical protein
MKNMETLFIEKKNTASFVIPECSDEGFQVSAVFNTIPLNYFLWEFEIQQGSPFIKKEMIGTTIFTNNPIALPETEEDNFETGYYNDDYDIVAKSPVTKSFKVKVKIRSISRLQPKVFLDDDELYQAF